MQEAIAAFNQAVEGFTGTSRALAGTAETLLAEQQAARDREVERERKDRRRFGAMGVALVLLGAVMGWLLFLRYEDEQTRAQRSVLAEQQRRCSDVLIADALVRVSIYATARGGTDPTVIAHLRERVAATRTDPSQLDELRDEVAAVLGALPPDTSGLREDAQAANDRLLRMRDICYEGTPPDDPLAS